METEDKKTFTFTIQDGDSEKAITFEPNPPSVYWRNQFIMIITRLFGVPKDKQGKDVELNVDFEDLNTLPPNQLKKVLKVAVKDELLQVRNIDVENKPDNYFEALAAIRFFFINIVSTPTAPEQ